MTSKEIEAFALDFRDGLLGEKSSHGMCWVVAQPLSALLNEIGVDNRLVKFEIEADRSVQPLDVDVIEHFVLLVGKKVLDPTADQFVDLNENLRNKIYFGPRPIWYKDST